MFRVLLLLIAAGALAAPKPWYHDPALGFWFFALAIITASGAAAALAEGLALFSVLGLLAAGSGILAGALVAGTLIAAALGATNLGTALTFGQIAFALALVCVLLKR